MGRSQGLMPEKGRNIGRKDLVNLGFSRSMGPSLPYQDRSVSRNGTLTIASEIRCVSLELAVPLFGGSMILEGCALVN